MRESCTLYARALPSHAVGRPHPQTTHFLSFGGPRPPIRLPETPSASLLSLDPWSSREERGERREKGRGTNSDLGYSDNQLALSLDEGDVLRVHFMVCLHSELSCEVQ